MSMVLAGKKGGTLADINVTPMIDVLLVLLIIFMVVQQGMQRGLAVQVPPVSSTSPGSPEQLVLEVRPGVPAQQPADRPGGAGGAAPGGVRAPRAQGGVREGRGEPELRPGGARA
jgi:hypothetical protein